jgi:transcription elongation GreA/GreB family factor
MVEPMAEPTGSGETEPSAAARERLEGELAQVREQRRRMSAQLGGEDPTDPDRGDSGDAAAQLEGLDDLARTDQRIDEIQRLIAGSGVPDSEPGLADGTVVTLRFPDGDVTYRAPLLRSSAGTVRSRMSASDRSERLST